MLPTQHRLRKSQQFAQIIRKGKRSGNRYLVIHHLTGQLETKVPLVGFVVPKKALPRAVDRNRVKRQLRAIISRYISHLPEGLGMVIRVSGLCRGQTSADLEKYLQQCLNRIIDLEEINVGGKTNNAVF